MILENTRVGQELEFLCSTFRAFLTKLDTSISSMWVKRKVWGRRAEEGRLSSCVRRRSWDLLSICRRRGGSGPGFFLLLSDGTCRVWCISSGFGWTQLHGLEKVYQLIWYFCQHTLGQCFSRSLRCRKREREKVYNWFKLRCNWIKGLWVESRMPCR